MHAAVSASQTHAVRVAILLSAAAPLLGRAACCMLLSLTDSRVLHADLNVSAARAVSGRQGAESHADLAGGRSVLSRSTMEHKQHEEEWALGSIPTADACFDLSRLALTLMLLSSRLMSTRLMLTASPSVNS